MPVSAVCSGNRHCVAFSALLFLLDVHEHFIVLQVRARVLEVEM